MNDQEPIYDIAAYTKAEVARKRKLTKETLDERIDDIFFGVQDLNPDTPFVTPTVRNRMAIKQLLKDYTSSIVPEEVDNYRFFLSARDVGMGEDEIQLFAKMRQHAHNKAIDTIHQNTKDLLGDTEC